MAENSNTDKVSADLDQIRTLVHSANQSIQDQTISAIDTIENRCNEIQREWQPLCMLVMDIEHLSGKEAIELVRQKSKENM